MTVTDRQNLNKILAEQKMSESGSFSEENYARIGRLTNARYLLTGSITKAQNSYFLELAISDAESGERKASYPPKSCTAAALQGLSAVKAASEDLFTQLGISLTGAGKQALLGVTSAAVNAETALSRALAAQKNGTVVEALSYFYQAVNYDSTLSEAVSRLNILTANISSGNMGADARNDIQWRKNWISRLEECERYFAGYMKEPAAYTLVYSTDLKQGKIDYEKETLDISGVTLYLIPNDSWFEIPEKVVNEVQKGLVATGRTKDWGLNWPQNSVSKPTPFVHKTDRFGCNFFFGATRA
jgi:hypothetical protein